MLQTNFDPTYQNVVDISGGCGASYEIQLVSAKFEGVSLLARHRMVNGALGTPIISQVHALVLVNGRYLIPLENLHSKRMGTTVK